MARFKLTLSIGLQGKQEEFIDIPDDEIPDDPVEWEQFLDDYWQTWANGYIDGGMSRVDGE